MEKIKITKEYLSTGGDEISHYKAKFENNPTLEEFVNWILKENPMEWGYVRSKWIPGQGDEKYVEYSHGKIVKLCDDYPKIKNKTIELLNMDGGWTAMDYVVKFVD